MALMKMAQQQLVCMIPSLTTILPDVLLAARDICGAPTEVQHFKDKVYMEFTGDEFGLTVYTTPKGEAGEEMVVQWTFQDGDPPDSAVVFEEALSEILDGFGD
jgi:hypothetical protein